MARCVLVTGASGGIGKVVAATFAQNGDCVVLVYNRHAQAAKQLCEELRAQGCSAMAVQADITQEKQVDALFAVVEKTFGAVEVLVNNAGIAQQKLFCDITEAEWDEMFAVHVKGTFLCCKRALPNMIQQKKGNIVNVSSMWGQVGASCESHYAAAKAAVIGLTKSLAKEEGPSGIRVNCVAPGAVKTGMMRGFSKEDTQVLCDETPLCKLATPQDVAEAVVYLASPKAACITGQVLAVNGGFVV